MINAKWLQSVIKVGGGCGFVMADDQENLVVVTAAHCLSHLPEACPGSARWERTYEQLLGRGPRVVRQSNRSAGKIAKSDSAH
jgi:hypothetical protein